MTTEGLSDFFWEQFLDLIDVGSVVPVVGQDLLRVRHEDRDVLLYPWLAARLAESLDVSAQDLPLGNELDAVARRYQEKHGELQHVYVALHLLRSEVEQLPVSEPLRQLAKIKPFRLFVTTTFDSLLQRALDDARFGGRKETRALAYSHISKSQDLPAEPYGPTVFHLFGRLEGIPTYAVTQEDTLEFMHALQARVNRPEQLFDELKIKNLLVLGSSFSGWLARFFLRTAKRQRLSAVHGIYLADARVRDDPSLVSFLRTYGGKTRVFERGAVEFVDELHHRWAKRHPDSEGKADPAVPPPVVKPGSVFLSYASEDRKEVKALRDALDAAGIDVFFDKDKLKAGDDFGAELRRAIHDCSIFVPVISKHTLTQDLRFFRKEWRQALETALEAPESRRFILPVVLDDTSPKSKAIPERFRELQWTWTQGGQQSEFVAQVVQEYRNHQRGTAS